MVIKKLFTNMFVRTREASRAQTMAEYALILAGIAVVVFVSYKAMGCNIRILLNSADGKL
jgi:Flp pilus assembly pilin Flp